MQEKTSTFNLLARFIAAAQRKPDAIAIEDGHRQCSYELLLARANGLAQTLHAAGCRSGDRVAVWMRDRAELVSVMLGVFFCGAVFVPLEADAPAERLRRRLRWLRPGFLVSDADGGSAAAPHAMAVDESIVCVAASEEAFRFSGEPVLAHRADGRDPAYLYFTSGSTSEPKGFVGTLDALERRIVWEIETFGVESGARVAQLVTPTFDPWFRDVFVPLCAGGTVCIPPEIPARIEPERLIEWLRDARIELMHCGPTLLNAMVSAPARIRRLPALRTVLCSGETLHVSHARRWRRRFGHQVTLVNLYGASEATMFQFFHRVEAADEDLGFIPVGRPVPGVNVRLLDGSGATCAPGRVGEIHVGGDSLTLGYYSDPPRTAKAFVNLDYDSGEVFYRTGDLGVEFEAGRYRLIGRIDDQVKIRGVRIEPREVEDALIGYPLVATCAVVVRRDANGEPALVAYVVPETEYPPAVPEMRAYLRQRLPPQYLPAAFVVLKTMPLSTNGKVDRARLPDPKEIPFEPALTSGPPSNPLESTVASAWAQVLGLSAVGIEDQFLDLGGHSLSAMGLVSRLRELGFSRFSVRDVFDHPTVAGQAALLAALHGENPRGAGEGVGFQTAAVPVQSILGEGFGCPLEVSPHVGRQACALAMVLGDDDNRESFEKVARFVSEIDPAIQVFVVDDTSGWWTNVPKGPTLVFSTAMLRHRPPFEAVICCGYPLAKSEEYRVLERAGIRVPRWATLTADRQPDLSGFGKYVVRKPDYGAKGAEIRIVRKDRVRWKPVVTSAAGPSPQLLVQEFVYTGPWPVSYRVNTLFGRVLYSMKITGNRLRPTLAGSEDFSARGAGGRAVSIVSNARDSSAELCVDAEIIRLGERAARAFPDIPMLGVDVLRDAVDGRLFVTEVNALGHNWNFTPDFAAVFRLDIAGQFDGLRKAACVLAEETQSRLATRRRGSSVAVP